MFTITQDFSLSSIFLSYLHCWYFLPTLGLFIILSILVHDYVLYLLMPPGPRPLPFLGNKLIIPKSAPWIQFEKWSQIYGPIFTLWIGRRPTVIISDPSVAVDLLEKRSNKYSSRPRFIVMGELYWDNAGILVQPYGKAWQIRRRLLHQALNPSALRLYKPVQEAEASRLVYSLLCNPASYEALIDRFTASVVFSIAYGHRIDSMNSKIIGQRLEFMQYAASLNVPGRFLVETLPFLKYIPNCLAPWKAEIQDRGRVEAAVNMALVRQVQEDIKRAKHPSDVPDSLTKILLEARADDPVAFLLLSDRDFAFVPASLFGAGSDTTASTLCSAILMLVTNPVTLQAAHAELDAVVGSARSPTFTDDAKLPYIKALCAEILRIRPVAVLGDYGFVQLLGHQLEPDLLPEPAPLQPLALLPDSTPPESLPYMPRSYITSTPQEKSTTPHPSKDGHSSFGWGRRVCPGAGLAQNSLFIALAKLLWAYDVLPVREEDGSERTYDTFAYTEGFNVRPRPFECVIRVRSEAHRAVLEREMGETAEVLQRLTPFEE